MIRVGSDKGSFTGWDDRITRVHSPAEREKDDMSFSAIIAACLGLEDSTSEKKGKAPLHPQRHLSSADSEPEPTSTVSHSPTREKRRTERRGEQLRRGAEGGGAQADKRDDRQADKQRG